MRFRFLLQPNWLLLTLVVFVFTAACYAVLAPWQFSRNADQQAQNSALTSSFTSKPVPLDSLVPAGVEPSGQAVWRLVTMTGRYEPAGETMARLRTVQGEPAFEIVTPFRLTDGRTVLVDRGHEAPQAGRSVPTYLAPPTGQVTITARAQDDEPADKRPSFLDTGKRQIYSINAATVATATGVHLDPGYYQLDQNQPGVVAGGAIPLPQLDDGPYFSYAIQWLIFGSMALFGWGYFTWREARPGGALDNTDKPAKPKRKSVAEILAEDEALEREQAAASQR
ncbi:SURF1 family protein [Kutzneria sp. 744]|uniref:SURF1 family cytochrome oxidase biogenesis protein n=1 Tax=Kutzneria sp. (strain 744) TaxID=345341 RepID=UPI0003EEB2AB|nr:SURF1 family cytochrome oxidase biogenesis protein [Kutzneria sp. 744]EWM13846.1 membrane protein [Kutzneria sp. 744]